MENWIPTWVSSVRFLSILLWLSPRAEPRNIILVLSLAFSLLPQVALGFTAKDLHSGSNHGVNVSPSTIRASNQTRSDSKAGYITPLAPREPSKEPRSSLSTRLLIAFRSTRLRFVKGSNLFVPPLPFASLRSSVKLTSQYVCGTSFSASFSLDTRSPRSTSTLRLREAPSPEESRSPPRRVRPSTLLMPTRRSFSREDLSLRISRSASRADLQLLFVQSSAEESSVLLRSFNSQELDPQT